MKRFFSMVVMLAAPLCAQPTDKERVLGKQLAGEVLRHAAIVDVRGAQEYVDELAKRIAAELPGGFEYRVSLVREYPADPSRWHSPVAS